MIRAPFPIEEALVVGVVAGLMPEIVLEAHAISMNTPP